MSPSNASSRAAAHLDPTQPLATPRHYLPRDINDFVGRKLEIAEVTASAINSAVALSIMTISGMGGVGKTALAVRAAHEIIDQYPDGQYFVDLQGFSEGVAPLTPNEALSVLLQAAGVAPEVVPIGINQRSALWRSTLAGQQALVVLDNAVDAAQVRPLLPGTAQNFVIITSRRRLSAIEGEVALSLDVLAPHEAIELLTAIVGKERIDGQEHAVEQVAELCGHLPLALRIAGARLRDRVSWTVPYLVDQLTDQTRRHQVLSTDDRSVMAVLSLSYRLLTDTQQRLVRTLSLHPGADFDVFAAAAMAELTVDEVAIALEALDDHHLLLQQVPGRYRFHDLVRDWAQSLTVEDDGEGKALALQRIADYYLNTVHDWTAPFARGPLRFTPHLRWPTASKPAVDSEAQRWEHLRLEFPNVVAVVRMVFDRAWHSQAWQLVCALQPYLKQIHYGGDSLELFEGALRSSRAAGHWRGESACLTGLASALAERRFHARATTALAEAIAISRANHDTEAELIQLAILGSIMLDELKFADAYQQLSAGVTAAMDVGDDDALASLENNLGVACAEMGRADEAIRHFDRAIRLFVKTGNERPIALAQVNIGVALCRLARWTDAIDVLSDGLDRSRTHEIVRAQGWALATLCLARRVLADFDAALSCGSEALDLAREFQLADVEVEALPAIGETLLAMGDLDNAAHTFSNVQDIAASHSLALGHARAKEGLAHVALARGDVSGAQRHWQEAQRLYPADAADADGPRRHLDATVCGAAVVCLRCAVRSGVERCGEMLETCGSVGKGVPSR